MDRVDFRIFKDGKLDSESYVIIRHKDHWEELVQLYRSKGYKIKKIEF